MRHLARLAMLAALTAPMVGCSTHPPPPLSARALAASRHFTQLPVYWVGQRFDGFALTASDRPGDYDRSLGMRVYYGDCLHRQSPLAMGGCTLPLEVNTVMFKPHSNSGLGPQHQIELRGVPGVVYDDGRSIELYTGHVAIDVLADTPARALRAARRLRAVNLNVPLRAARLPPPLYEPPLAAS